MKILITGNLGYIGAVAVPYFATHGGFELHGFDIGYFKNILTGPSPDIFLAQQHWGDLKSFFKSTHTFGRVNQSNHPNKKQIEFLLKDVEAIIHLGALSNDAMGFKFDQLTHQINTLGSLELAAWAKKMGVPRFIFASSCSVYGNAGGRIKTETDIPNPLTAYAKSKLTVELELKKMASPDFQVTALRFSTAYGASSRLRLDLVLNDFVATALSEKKIKIQSDGAPIRPLVHVKDIAKSLHWAMHRLGDDFCVLNIGSNNRNYSIKALAEACADVLGNIQVEINPNALPDARSYQVDFSKYQAMAPLHQPSINLDQAIEALVKMCRGLDLSDRSRYIRLAALEKSLADSTILI